MRDFVAACGDEADTGLLVAAHGLREAQVSPDGVIAVTLLRCFGWLSRDDLSNRLGPAGPAMPTPGGQSPGPHRFQLSVVPYTGDVRSAGEQARAFHALPRAAVTPLHPGVLPPEASFLEVEPHGFELTAVKEAEDGAAWVVRGVNLTSEPLRVRLRTLLPLRAVYEARLDETPLRELPIGDGQVVALSVGPHALATLRLETGDVGGRG